jgi:hypothetical protein
VHTTFENSTNKNIWRTVFLKNWVEIKKHDIAFHASWRAEYYNTWAPCDRYSKIDSITDLWWGEYSIWYGYYEEWTLLHASKTLRLKLWKKDIYNLEPKVSVFWSVSKHFLARLELWTEDWYTYMSEPYYPDFWSTTEASNGSWLYWSRWFGVDSCTLWDINETDENYEIAYQCTVYLENTSAAAWSPAGIDYKDIQQTVVLSKEEYNLCNYDEQYCKVSAPLNLTQSYILPQVWTEQEIAIWESLWKFQSWSWIILKSFIPALDRSDLNYIVDINFLDEWFIDQTPQLTPTSLSSNDSNHILMDIVLGIELLMIEYWLDEFEQKLYEM